MGTRVQGQTNMVSLKKKEKKNMVSVIQLIQFQYLQ